MKQVFSLRSFLLLITVAVIGGIIYWVVTSEARNAPELITTTVAEGSVRQLVSVSGVAKATARVELAFPKSGIIDTVLVSKGQVVEAGQPLVTLSSKTETADKQGATAALASAIADLNQLLAGPTATDRDETSQTVATKEAALATTIENQERLVENAKRALYSTSPSIYSNNSNEEAIAPVVSGTYTCTKDGTYRLEVYSSSGASGYSYRLSGIETGTFEASADQAIALGNCGLRIRFDADSNYSRSVWFLDIPNKKSPEYTVLLNAYELAKTVAASSIAVATQELQLATARALNQNAPPRNEARVRANAKITEAQARLARIDSGLDDNTLTAPFAGTVTDIDILPGETVGVEPIVTIVAPDAFEVIARVPEIDIGKLAIKQSVEMVFDAKGDEVITGTISFMSLQATEINGVAYYEATILPTVVPPWMRNGLNADVNIIFSETTNTLKIPSRFLISTDGTFSVLRKNGEAIATTTIEVTLEGNDGFVAVTGLTKGDTLVAP
jgi:multidrug efflux pump subunit AcrA (membrane-fusion protein)